LRASAKKRNEPLAACSMPQFQDMGSGVVLSSISWLI
jgi:hypothetical protein